MCAKDLSSIVTLRFDVAAVVIVLIISQFDGLIEIRHFRCYLITIELIKL